MTVRDITEADREQWARMRDRLWPGSPMDHDLETRRHFSDRLEAPLVFVAEADGQLIGFLELDFRKYAPGCRSSPVPFIEGWYVEPAWRRHGVGSALVRAAEARARSLGHTELGSDTEIQNQVSITVHRALGYKEVERTVAFRRSLVD